VNINRYALLAISAVLAFGLLVIARVILPIPLRLAEKNRVGYGIGSIILYTVAAGRFVAGPMSHEVVFCHLSKKIPD